MRGRRRPSSITPLLRLFPALVVVACAGTVALPALALGDAPVGELDAPPLPPSDDAIDQAALPSSGQPEGALAASDGEKEAEEGESCFANPLYWVIGGVVAAVVAVGGVVCAIPACGGCSYLGLVGCSYGAVGSLVGCAACSANSGGGAVALGGVALAVLGGVAGGALLATGEPTDLTAPTTLAGAALLGVAAVTTTALAGVGLALALHEPDEGTAPLADAAGGEERSLLLSAKVRDAPVAY